jgi:hypothetical protein
MILESLDVSPQEFAEGTGWVIKPEGACKADVCVPLGSAAGSSACTANGFDLASAAERLGMAIVHDADAGLWALGPESLNGHALVSAQAPELVLDDIDGNEFRLSSLLGQKVVIVSWAPY